MTRGGGNDIEILSMNHTCSKVDLHPISIKAITNGHPWVTVDEFSKKFPPNNDFLIALNNEKKEFALLLNDPTHKTIKARLWSLKKPLNKEVENFKTELSQRLYQAINKRKELRLFKERENVYLVFGEADNLPGLFVQVLKENILIQYYSNFWLKYEHILLEALGIAIKKQFYHWNSLNFWVQVRGDASKNEIRKTNIPNMEFISNDNKEFIIKEFDLNYKIRFDENYDIGIYTDMSELRKNLFSHFEKSKLLLNLFSYTGAFSLTALKYGAKVTSVDLSQKYMDWLEENIKLNPTLDLSSHKGMVTSVDKAIHELKSKNEKFDFIICDPPSASSDGGKVSQAFKNYETLLPDLVSLMKEKGFLLVFLNTHAISWDRFEEKILNILELSRMNTYIRVIKKFNLSADCSTLKGFPEGMYLKGILLNKL